LSFILAKYRKKLSYYDQITGMSKILRRYFVLNAFDGALTIFGVLMGTYVLGTDNPVHIIKLGLATSIAVGISGLWGSFFTEAAERKRELNEIEKAVHKKLDKSELKEAYDFASVITAIVDGGSPFLAAIFVLIPFFFTPALIDLQTAYLTAFGLSVVVFFLIGAFLGKISNESIWKTGLKLVGAGIVALIIISMLGVE
jgi:predicted membrane protein (TIGR00267 family)